MLTPAPWVALVTRDGPKELAEQFRGDLELPPEPLQFLVEHACKGQQIIPLVLQLPTDRPQPMGTQRYAALQFGHHEVIKCASLGVARPGQGENVVAEPPHQQCNIIGQGDGRIARVTG